MPELIVGEQDQEDREAEKDSRKQRAIALFTTIFRPVEDFTIVIHDKYFGSDRWFDEFIREQKPSVGAVDRPIPKWWSVEFGIPIKLASPKAREARIHACRAFGDRAWSLTVRWKLKDEDVECLAKLRPVGTLKKALEEFAPPDGLADGEKKYLVSLETLVDRIFAEWPKPFPSTGFALVTGGTGTGKSNVVRGLIYRYLSRVTGQSRTPHLITLEDPVEKWLRQPSTAPHASPKASDFPISHVDYTPRTVGRGYDCRSVEEGLLKDALRQTPAVAYVGELRKPDEFVACLNFAATGHFVIATAHAGSVTESMAKALSAVEAKSPGARASYASRMLCVVHLKRLNNPAAEVCTSNPPYEPLVVPAMWRRSQTAIQQLVADGLASVLPSKPSSAQRDAFCLGRAYFLDKLLEQVASDRMPSADYRDHLRSTALEDDLNG